MTADSRYADNNGTRLHYTVQGDGPLIVAVHGFPDYHGTWDDLLPFLTDGYRVAAMDLRGYNLSDQPDEVDAYQMQTLCADVVAVIKAEGENSAILLSHDHGAGICWQIAIHAPQFVERLISFSVPHPALFRQELGQNEEQQTRSAYARKFQQDGSEENLSVEILMSLHNHLPDDRQALYRAAFARSSFRAMMHYYRRAYPRGTSPKPADPTASPKVKCPVLIIHGLEDVALLASGHNNSWDYVARDLTLMTLPDAGHWLHHEQPALVGGTIRHWLDLRRDVAPQQKSG